MKFSGSWTGEGRAAIGFHFSLDVTQMGRYPPSDAEKAVVGQASRPVSPRSDRPGGLSYLPTA